MHVLPSPRSQHQLSKCKNHRQTQYWRGVRKNSNTTNTFLFLLYKSIRVDLYLSFLSLSPLRARTKKAEKQNKEREERDKNPLAWEA